MILRLSGKKAIGIKQTMKAVKNSNALKVYVAKDVEKKFTSAIEQLCLEEELQLEYVNTSKELGKLCGIDVGAAACAILKEA